MNLNVKNEPTGLFDLKIAASRSVERSSFRQADPKSIARFRKKRRQFWSIVTSEKNFALFVWRVPGARVTRKTVLGSGRAAPPRTPEAPSGEITVRSRRTRHGRPDWSFRSCPGNLFPKDGATVVNPNASERERRDGRFRPANRSSVSKSNFSTAFLLENCWLEGSPAFRRGRGSSRCGKKPPRGAVWQSGVRCRKKAPIAAKLSEKDVLRLWTRLVKPLRERFFCRTFDSESVTGLFSGVERKRRMRAIFLKIGPSVPARSTAKRCSFRSSHVFPRAFSNGE
ncbi:hypothetical protein NPIL_679801 [Nephila pilipes]|uniref:Uncharacterized protein n=1 Tax=Nephila pilipes TaxID=299642 RepID=A0A8X6PWS6_NEPPI|nr:hypothetical protein NPIL_679801 [Nephila pilipes]